MHAKPTFLAVLSFAAFIGIISFCQIVNADEREPSSAGEAGEKAGYFNCNRELEYLKSSEKKINGEEPKGEEQGRYRRQIGGTCYPTSTVNAKIDVYRLKKDQAEQLYAMELFCLVANGYYTDPFDSFSSLRSTRRPQLPLNPTISERWNYRTWQDRVVKECNEKAVSAVLHKRPQITILKFGDYVPPGQTTWEVFDSQFWQTGGCKWLKKQLQQNNGVVLSLYGSRGGHAVQLVDVFCLNGKIVLEIRNPNFPEETQMLEVGPDGYIVGPAGSLGLDSLSDALGWPIEVGEPYVISAGPS